MNLTERPGFYLKGIQQAGGFKENITMLGEVLRTQGGEGGRGWVFRHSGEFGVTHCVEKKKKNLTTGSNFPSRSEAGWIL